MEVFAHLERKCLCHFCHFDHRIPLFKSISCEHPALCATVFLRGNYGIFAPRGRANLFSTYGTMNKDQLELLESKGAATVLLEMAQGSHGMPESALRTEVECWLRAKQVEAGLAASSKRDAREAETRRIAICANIIAAIALAIAAINKMS